MPRLALDSYWLGILARGGAVVTFLASVYLLLAKHPLGAGRLPDWVGHLVLFAALGLCIGLSAATTRAGEASAARRRVLLAGLVAIALYGPLTEVAQYVVGRDAEWSDAAIDIAASLPAFALGTALPRLLRARPQL
ncbi:MAG: hypothetical protein DWI48_03175 [Chloroflexi bacterium]|nr:MAG: hypothetical protein DWI48_03175 [Chloroflexota bacterium]